LDSLLAERAAIAVEAASAAWDNFQPHLALEMTWKLIGDTNSFLEDNAPWKMEPGSDVDAVLGSALEALRIVTILVSPAMPATADEIWRRLALDGSPTSVPLAAATEWGQFPVGRAVVKGDPLFPRLATA
jgi:methionyl-tRNA synthetase